MGYEFIERHGRFVVLRFYTTNEDGSVYPGWEMIAEDLNYKGKPPTTPIQQKSQGVVVPFRRNSIDVNNNK